MSRRRRTRADRATPRGDRAPTLTTNRPVLVGEPLNSQLQTEDAWRAVWAAELSSRK